MIINLEWDDFHTRYYLENMIYVKEHNTYFEFITNIDGVLIRAVKDKHDNSEENVIFIERYMTDKKNIVKVLNFDNYKEPEEVETVKEETEFEVKLENDI